MEERKNDGKIIVNGHAQFENGRLVTPIVSAEKNKTAEELIAEIPGTPEQRKIDREIKKIEENYQKKKEKYIPKQKDVKAETLIKKLEKIDGVTHYFNKYENVIKYGDRTVCWVADRKKWVAVSTWDKGGRNYTTKRVATQKDLYSAFEEIKERIEKLK